MSNLITHGILHHTLIHPTVAKHKSNVNYSFIYVNTNLYQDVSEHQATSQAKSSLLATKVCGNHLCVRKRKVAMERDQHAAFVPRAVSSSPAQASEVSLKCENL